MGKIDWVENNVEKASLLIVALSLVPILVEVLRHRKAKHHSA